MPSRNHLPNYLLVDYSLCLFAFIFEYLIALHFWKLMVALPDKLIHYCNDVPESPIQVTELATSFFPHAAKAFSQRRADATVIPT